MPSGISVDTSQFREAIRFVFENTQKSLPDIVNRASLVAIIGGRGVQGAMQRTRKATRAAILAIPRKTIASVVMKKHKGEKLNKQEINRLIRKEYSRRIAAIGYTAYVGWNNAAIAFGGRGIGNKDSTGGYAELGEGKPAAYRHLVAEFSNTTPAAPVWGIGPLQEALDDTARDMVEHVQKKMQEIFNQVSVK